jgi:hypothetical protein
MALRGFDVFRLVTLAEDAAMTAHSAHLQRELADLRFHWDEAYKITCHPGEAEPCHAERLDDGTVLTGDTPWSSCPEQPGRTVFYAGVGLKP